MPLFGCLKVNEIKQRHGDNGGDQKKDREFAQDGNIVDRGRVMEFFEFEVHGNQWFYADRILI